MFLAVGWRSDRILVCYLKLNVSHLWTYLKWARAPLDFSLDQAARIWGHIDYFKNFMQGSYQTVRYDVITKLETEKEIHDGAYIFLLF